MFFSIDVETSGPVPGLFNMLSLGIVSIEQCNGQYQPKDANYIEFRPVFPGYLKASVDVAGLDIDRLKRVGIAPCSGMKMLRHWVLSQLGSHDSAVFTGYNAPFDWSFVNYYFAYTEMGNPFGTTVLDITSMASGACYLAPETVTKQGVASLLGLAPEDTTQKHHAGYDALYQATIFCELMNKKMPSIESVCV